MLLGCGAGRYVRLESCERKKGEIKLSTAEQLSASASSSHTTVRAALHVVDESEEKDGTAVVQAVCCAARGEVGRYEMGTWKSAAVKVLTVSLCRLLVAAVRAVAGRTNDAGEDAERERRAI